MPMRRFMSVKYKIPRGGNCNFMKKLALGLIILFLGQSNSYAFPLTQSITSKDVISFPYEILEKAYGKETAGQIRFRKFKFSPDNQLLAFSISDISTGDPEQIWIFDLATKELRPAMPVQTRATSRFERNYFKDFFWKDAHTLWVNGTKRHKRYVASDGGRRVESFHSDGWEKISDSSPSISCDGKYEVFYKPVMHQHGTLNFREVKNPMATTQIVGGDSWSWGSWEASDSWALSPHESVVAFGESASISFYDLEKKKLSAKLLSGTKYGKNQAMAWSPTNFLVFVAHGTCSADIEKPKINLPKLNRGDLDWPGRERICIVPLQADFVQSAFSHNRGH